MIAEWRVIYSSICSVCSSVDAHSLSGKPSAGPLSAQRSERGRVADQGDTLWLLGRAVINRPALADQQAVNVVTSDVMVKPKADTAETSAAAVITSGRYRIEGVGMLANFRESRLDLHSRVRGRIDAGG